MSFLCLFVSSPSLIAWCLVLTVVGSLGLGPSVFNVILFVHSLSYLYIAVPPDSVHLCLLFPICVFSP